LAAGGDCHRLPETNLFNKADNYRPEGGNMKRIIFASLALSFILGFYLSIQAQNKDRRNPPPPAIGRRQPPPPAIGIGRAQPPPPAIGVGRRQPPPPVVGIGDGGRGNGVPHYHIGDGPDLIVSEFSISPAIPVQGDPVSVRVGVYNQGNQHTGPFTVQWWPGENYREPAKTWHVDGVRARGGRILTFTYNGYPSWYAQLRTKVAVDTGRDVSESEERNNTRTMMISVSRP
jgi:CARDB